MALTVGAWTNEVLAHLGMQLSLEIWKVHWGHYYVDPALQHRLPQWYRFCKLRPGSWDEGLYYGFPPETSEPVVKASRLMTGSCLTAAPCVAAVCVVWRHQHGCFVGSFFCVHWLSAE